MKLKFRRDVVERSIDKGILRKEERRFFILTCHIELTEEEKVLISKYRIDDWPIIKINEDECYYVHDLEGSIRLEHWRLSFIKEWENNIIGACKNIKKFLDATVDCKGKEITLDLQYYDFRNRRVN